MTEILFETGVNLAETLILTDFVTRYLGAKKDVRGGFLLCWLVAFGQMCIMNSVTAFETAGAFIPILIYFIYALIFLKGSVGAKLWIAFFAELITYMTGVAANLLLCNIIGYDPADMITVFNATRVIGVVISKVALFYITRIILSNRYAHSLSKYKWLMLLVMPAVSLISMGALMKAALNTPAITPYITVGLSCIVVADMMTYWFYIVMNKEYENAVAAKLLQQQNEALRQSIADKEAFVGEMKKVRHDIKNQLLTAMHYADAGRCDEIKAYLRSLTDNYLPNVFNYVNTGNGALDAVVNSKVAVCNRSGIFVQVSVMQGTAVNILPEEIAVLFGNLLDNAIEAAKLTEEKRVGLDLKEHGEYLLIEVTNSIKDSVLKKNCELETTKPDKELHGIGLRSVRDVVKRHNGTVRFYEEGNEFCCHIMLENS